MDLELAGKVAVVTGASKGIGLAVARELAAEGAHVVAGARTVAPLEGLEGIDAVRRRPHRSRRPGPARRPRRRAARPARRAGQQRRRRAAAPRRLLRTSPTPTSRPRSSSTSSRRCARCARRSPRCCDARRGHHRQRHLGQRLLPARRRGHRLRRGQGGAAQRRQGAVAGARAARHPHRQRLAGPGGDRPVAGRRRRRRDHRARDGRRRRQRPRPGDRPASPRAASPRRARSRRS